MVEAMKKILKKIFVMISKLIVPLFFNKKYLKSKYFTDSDIGWKWAWRSIWHQKLGGVNRQIPWPVSHSIVIGTSYNIEFDLQDINNFQTYGCYFQNYYGRIFIGKGSFIAPNVGIITQNHDIYNPSKDMEPKDVVLGKYCWIGMNSVILPGVVLGDHTVVGAGSVVTKSFSKGYCVIAGNPAKLIKELDREKFQNQ